MKLSSGEYLTILVFAVFIGAIQTDPIGDKYLSDVSDVSEAAIMNSQASLAKPNSANATTEQKTNGNNDEIEKSERLIGLSLEREQSIGELSTKLKGDVELLQPLIPDKDVDEPEELFNRASINFDTNEFTSEEIEVSAGKLKDGHIMAIFAGSLAFLCIGIYVGLISWRSYLEKRYGNRERLVTEDDYYNNNDVRQFSL